MIPRRYSALARAGGLVTDRRDHASVLFVSFSAAPVPAPAKAGARAGGGPQEAGASAARTFALLDRIYAAFDALVTGWI
jgi:hypothetical protein